MATTTGTSDPVAFLNAVIKQAVLYLKQERSSSYPPGVAESYLRSSLTAFDALPVTAAPEPAACCDCSANADRIAALDAECVTLCGAVDELREQLVAQRGGRIRLGAQVNDHAQRLKTLEAHATETDDMLSILHGRIEIVADANRDWMAEIDQRLAALEKGTIATADLATHAARDVDQLKRRQN